MRALAAMMIGSAMLGLLPGHALAGDALLVPLDRSVKISLPSGARHVMLGNSGILDITLVDMKTAVLLGRTYGGTNLLVLDNSGRTLMDQEILVADASPGRVTLFTGPKSGDESGGPGIQNFACSPHCVRYPMPGERDADQSSYVGPYESYRSRAATGAQGTATPENAGPMTGIAQGIGAVSAAMSPPVP